MTDKQLQWTISLALSFVALIATTTFNQGWGWIIGWVMWGGFSFIKLAIHGGLDTTDEMFD